MKTLLNLSLGLLFLVSFLTATSAATEPQDKLKIISVNTSEPIVRGVENEFTVEVEYNLDSVDEGEINLGFNAERPNAFKMVESFIVQKGPGVATLKAKVVPVDWGQRAKFTVMVNYRSIRTRVAGVRWLAPDNRSSLDSEAQSAPPNRCVRIKSAQIGYCR
ncbi:MAG: hypothetical protein ACREBG_08340 [Pyrinomonadaceae bacterium]